MSYKLLGLSGNNRQQFNLSNYAACQNVKGLCINANHIIFAHRKAYCGLPALHSARAVKRKSFNTQ